MTGLHLNFLHRLLNDEIDDVSSIRTECDRPKEGRKLQRFLVATNLRMGSYRLAAFAAEAASAVAAGSEVVVFVVAVDCGEWRR